MLLQRGRIQRSMHRQPPHRIPPPPERARLVVADGKLALLLAALVVHYLLLQLRQPRLLPHAGLGIEVGLQAGTAQHDSAGKWREGCKAVQAVAGGGGGGNSGGLTFAHACILGT